MFNRAKLKEITGMIAAFAFRSTHGKIVTGISLFYTICFNYPLYHLYYKKPMEIAFGLTGVFCFIFLLFLFLSLHRKTFTVLVPVLVFISSLAAYFIYIYHIYINESVIALVFETTAEESGGLIGIYFLLWMVFCMAVTFCAVWLFRKYQIQPDSSVKRVITIVFILTIPLVFLLRGFLPYNVPIQFGNYIKYRIMLDHSMNNKTDISTKGFSASGQDLTVVLIIGESARADHFHINGYARQTSPEIERENVDSFGIVRSCAGDTRTSIPCMMTMATEQTVNESFGQTSMISVFRRCGFYTAWISNQGFLGRFESPVTSIAKESNYYFFSNKTGNYAGMGKIAILDDDLIPHLDKALENPVRRRFIVLHTIGSHWRYDQHYPASFKKYVPVCVAESPNYCEHSQLINSYDNSILYADHVIASVIEHVKAKGINALVVYTSDHGEGLGEKGIYGHVQNETTPGRRVVPFFVWASDRYIALNPDKYKNLKTSAQKKKNAINHDWLFHSVLDGSGIESKLIDKNLSIFSKQ
ncbi:MAG TPA: sulfatase-like hydrolase/transferase [Spirochaetota bacterium]